MIFIYLVIVVLTGTLYFKELVCTNLIFSFWRESFSFSAPATEFSYSPSCRARSRMSETSRRHGDSGKSRTEKHICAKWLGIETQPWAREQLNAASNWTFIAACVLRWIIAAPAMTSIVKKCVFPFILLLFFFFPKEDWVNCTYRYRCDLK